MALILSGDGSVGPLSSTEMGYLDGVTSAVQTQINGKVTTPGVWTTYTPSVTCGTGFAIGTGGSVTGRYSIVGKVVTYRVYLVFGSSGVNPGNGIYYIGLPVPAVSASGVHGSGVLYDSSTGSWRLCVPSHSDENNVALIIELANAPGAYGVTWYNIPWTWAASDSMTFMGTYEAA